MHLALASKKTYFCCYGRTEGHWTYGIKDAVHIVWFIEVFDAEGVRILKGVVSNNHVHMHLEYRPSQDVSTFVKKLEDRSSRKLQQEFRGLKKKYWDDILGQ